MKKRWIVTVLILLFVAVSAFPQSTEPVPQAATTKQENIRRLLEITGSAQLAMQMMSQMVGSFRKSMPQVPPEFWDAFVKEVNAGELVDLIVPIYDKHLTSEEIAKLIEFYESPVGQKLISVQPKINQESYQVGEEWGRKIGERVVKELQEKGYSVD